MKYMVKRVPAITWDVVSTWKSWDIHYQPINWCCSPEFQTINRKGWSSSNRIFFPVAMYVNFRKATKAVTYQKGMKSDQILIFHQPSHSLLRHGHPEIQISPTGIFSCNNGIFDFPSKKLCPGRVRSLQFDQK